MQENDNGLCHIVVLLHNPRLTLGHCPTYFPLLIIQLTRFGYKIVNVVILVDIGCKIVPQKVFKTLKRCMTGTDVDDNNSNQVAVILKLNAKSTLFKIQISLNTVILNFN